ncbi:MAG: hypothetical protein JSV26_05675 [bacterium]|nr:MAG: hypothetical protein JSV26_05675 [bacterium]
MNYDRKKVDEAVLALLHLTTFQDDSGFRTWKGHDWEVLNRLHEDGYIANPKSKSRSVEISDEGRQRSSELFERHFK